MNAPLPDLVVVAETSLTEAKRLAELLASRDIRAWIGGEDCCASGGCGPKAAILVGRSDVVKVAEVMRSAWLEAVERENPEAAARILRADEAIEGDPPCPACGHLGPLVGGACGDCGLQLE